MHLVFAGFSAKLESRDQFVILARVSFMSTALESNSLTLEWLYNEVSSAYWTRHSHYSHCSSETCDIKPKHGVELAITI